MYNSLSDQVSVLLLYMLTMLTLQVFERLLLSLNVFKMFCVIFMGMSPYNSIRVHYLFKHQLEKVNNCLFNFLLRISN